MANVIVQSIMKYKSCISTADKVEGLFGLIKGLIKYLDVKLLEVLDDEDFQEEQNSFARLIQMLPNDDPEEMFKIICIVKNHILTGGTKRLPYNVPPLIFNLLQENIKEKHLKMKTKMAI